MGELTRSHEWSKTPLGEPCEWPQSLLTTLSIILNSRFPMFLFWGKEHLCFYNDAYRPSLGNEGKHPYALGKPGAEVWPEIWDLIAPQIRQVLSTGEATWFEDQLIPIYRNGHLEDVYWTYSYSPVKDESGQPAGVFVTCTETTKKMETLQRLTESEQRFQNLVREATVGIVVLTGEEMRVEIVNDAYGKLIGRTAEELKGRKLFDLIPEAGAPFRPLLNQVRETGEALYLYDHPYLVSANGQTIEGYLNLVCQPYRESNGPATGVLALCQDVTESVLAAKKIEESEQTLGLAIEIGELGVFKVDLENETATYSDRIKEWFGLEKQQWPLRKIISTVHPDDAPRLSQIITRSVAGENKGRHDVTYRVIHAKHNTVRYLHSIGQVEFRDGKAVGMSGILQDITLQVAADKERLAAVFNASQSGMFTFAPVRSERGDIVDFRFVITNPAFAAYVGQTPAVLNGALGSTWFPGYLTNGVFDMYKRTFETGGTARLDVHYNVDGHDLYLDLMSTKVGEEVLVTFNDYTPLKKAQLQLEGLVKDLKRSNQNLEEFAYAASHDLKEPIRKIRFFAERLRNKLQAVMKEEDAATFTRLETAAGRMNQLIDDLLAYSQLSLTPAATETVDLNTLMNVVLNELDLEIEYKGACITVEDLGSVRGYPRQMQQAFQNLLSNALKYSSPDRKPVIEVRKELTSGRKIPFALPEQASQKEYCRITVKDNGVGFEQSDAERIFQVFTRLHGNAETKGTGVGLAIVRKVVENHRGFVTAEGVEGEGAVFKLYLPL